MDIGAFLISAGLTIFIGLCAAVDRSTAKIPNCLTAAGGLLSLILCIIGYGPLKGAAQYALRVIPVLLLFYPLYRIGQLGAGDVKLLCIISSCISFRYAVFSFAIGMYVSLIPIIIRFIRSKRIKGMRIPISPLIFAGNIFCMVFGKRLGL